MATHLTALEREQLSLWLHMKVSKAEIARRLGRHPSTIFRELKRNSVRRRYSARPSDGAIAVQQRSDQRRRQRRRGKLQRPEIRQYVKQDLRKYWSPDQIAGRMRRDFAKRRLCVSHQAIYDWLANYEHARPLRLFLRRSRVRIRRPHDVARESTLGSSPASTPDWRARRGFESSQVPLLHSGEPAAAG